MGRPQRYDADYFPFVVKEGRTLFLLESKYGCTGTGFFTNVLRLLTATPNHHIRINDEADKMEFFARVKVDEATGEEMLKIMLKTGKLHNKLWNEYKVIYCPDLVESLKPAYEKRANAIITEMEIMVTPAETIVSGDKNPVSAPETQENGKKNDNNPQSKVKKSKEDQNIAPAPQPLHEKEIEPAQKQEKTLDPLYAPIWNSFLSEKKVFANYKKEGEATKALCKKARARAPDYPESFIREILELYLRLTKTGSSYWQGQPFIPSALNASGIWERVLVEYEKSEAKENVDWIKECAK